MSLERAIAELGWPGSEEILHPKSEGARVLASTAQEKFRRLLNQLGEKRSVRVGLLVPQETAESTPAPIALVCEFPNLPSESDLRTAHRFAWNYSKAPLLLTIDPASVRAWTCCETPSDNSDSESVRRAEIPTARIVLSSGGIEQQLTNALHWVNLISGRFFATHAPRFQPAGRLDQVLLNNLKEVRLALHRESLSHEITHDLLGRIIFIQFLFQRTDSSGKAALNRSLLSRLAADGVLSRDHHDLAGILSDQADAYQFFRWLNERFNGDLFPGKADNAIEREREWEREIQQVSAQHLRILSDFVSGQLHFDSGQRSLFPMYSFDTIPLEFISSIYEEFVSYSTTASSGVHYTPGHIVDLILDGVLPWDSNQWNIAVLDPACGSGIFLVKAFQRLIHRWKVAHPRTSPTAPDLKQILEKNIFGVDINGEAVRVASFSLYLAMCDEIDPRHYWTQVRFPRLRDRNLDKGDYFTLNDRRPDISSKRFDLIIGNAPWGRNTITQGAKKWAESNNWSASYGTVGPIFLPKSMELLTPDGIVSMLQPASVLTNSVGTAQEYRRRLFDEFKVEEVINLSALRFGLFANAVDPACVITLRPGPPGGERFIYICPKPSRSSLDDYRICIDAQDVHAVFASEATSSTILWSVLMWGNNRDLTLIRRLSAFPNLGKLQKKQIIVAREGIIRGNRGKKLPDILGRRIIEKPIAKDLSLEISIDDLPVNTDERVDSRASTDFSAFMLPQLIIKQGWTKSTGRFSAAIIKGKPESPGALCSQSYISVSCRQQHLLETVCGIYNSKVATYYLLLTSGRFAAYRPEPTMQDILGVPVPFSDEKIATPSLTKSTADSLARHALQFTASEWSLVEDVCSYTLPDFKGDADSPGRASTVRRSKGELDQLDAYCESVVKVLKSAFGGDKIITCTIFVDSEQERLPIRMAMIHLGGPPSSSSHRQITSRDLVTELSRVGEVLSSKEGAQVLRTRVARLYTTVQTRGSRIPTVVLIKPDQVRYWSMSAGLRDGDEIAADLLQWGTEQIAEASSSVH